MVLDFLGVGFQVYSQRVCCKENRSLCYKYICHGTRIKKNVAFLSQNHNRAYICNSVPQFLHHDLEHIRDASRHQQLIMSIHNFVTIPAFNNISQTCDKSVSSPNLAMIEQYEDNTLIILVNLLTLRPEPCRWF